MPRITSAALALVVAPALAAQEPPPPTFQAESQVVVLDVVARDGKHSTREHERIRPAMSRIGRAPIAVPARYTASTCANV